MSNWLYMNPPFKDGLGHASWHERSFAELTDVVSRTAFGKPIAEVEPP